MYWMDRPPALDFPEYFSRIKVFNHTNLQCGDSGIRELFTPLLKNKEINYKKRTRVNELYKDIYEKTKCPSLF